MEKHKYLLRIKLNIQFILSNGWLNKDNPMPQNQKDSQRNREPATEASVPHHRWADRNSRRDSGGWKVKACYKTASAGWTTGNIAENSSSLKRSTGAGLCWAFASRLAP